MKKSVFVSLFLLVLTLGFASAQYYGSYNYGGFQVDNYVSPDFVLYSFILLISFWFLNLILSRVPLFHGSDGGRSKQSTIGAFLISVGITYWTYNSGWSIDNLFYRLGFSSGLSDILFPLVSLVVIVLVIWKFRVRGLFLGSGLLLITISFTELVYDKNSVLVIGVILLLVGFWLWNRARKKEAKKAAENNNGNPVVNVNVGDVASYHRNLGGRMDRLSDKVKRVRYGG